MINVIFMLVLSLLTSSFSLADGLLGDSPREPSQAADGTTVLYGPDFFVRFPNTQNAADLVARIPGGQQVMGSGRGGGGSNRGFSNNNDGILINGRRITGKGNNSQSVLRRITKDQVKHIQLIRGSSPDIKSASQSAMINVVTKESQSSGSGTWSVGSLTTDTGYTRPSTKASYSGKSGNLEYFLSGEYTPDNRNGSMRDEFYDADDLLTQAIDFEMATKQNRVNLSGNMAYKMENGDLLRFNVTFKTGTKNLERRGRSFLPDAGANLIFDTNTLRLENYKNPNWEIGGDYGKAWSENWTLKFIGLYVNKGNDSEQRIDNTYDTVTISEDFKSFSSRKSTEAISRLSLSYIGFKGHDIEFGSEVAINTLNTDLEYLERISGSLQETSINNSALGVRETRIESFINDTWGLSEKATIETILVGEYSEIGITGDANNKRNFFFLKPTLDYRYNFNPKNQIKVSIIREVAQLNFNQFASSFSKDDEVIGGNEELVQWKNWRLALEYEHRFSNDAGSIKILGFKDDVSDTAERAEISPGVSGVANIGDSNYLGIEIEASFRLGFLGISDAVLDITSRISKASLTDSFTGEKRTPSWWDPKNVRFQFRQDVNDWGVSYELNFMISNPTNFVDINEISDRAGPKFMLWGSIEKRLSKNLILSFGGGPVFNTDNGRNRMIYASGIASGIITSRELRKKNDGRRFRFSLKGIF